jgi:hypothetical protein
MRVVCTPSTAIYGSADPQHSRCAAHVHAAGRTVTCRLCLTPWLPRRHAVDASCGQPAVLSISQNHTAHFVHQNVRNLDFIGAHSSQAEGHEPSLAPARDTLPSWRKTILKWKRCVAAHAFGCDAGQRFWLTPLHPLWPVLCVCAPMRDGLTHFV